MTTEWIASPRNPLLKEIRKASAKGTLTSGGLAVVEGPHLVGEALRAGCPVETVVCAGSAPEYALPGVARVVRVEDAVFPGLAATESPQGIIALVRLPGWPLDSLFSPFPPLLAILDGVQDPGNAGAIVRAAEAFGATGALFLEGCAAPFHPRTLRASAGSLFRLPVARLDAASALAELEQRRLRIYAAMPSGGLEPARARLSGPSAVVIGSEGRGIRPALAGSAAPLTIPTKSVESLNASVAAGVLFYEAWRQRACKQ